MSDGVRRCTSIPCFRTPTAGQALEGVEDFA